MNVFAGFWVDGAVRRPEAKHANALNHVVYQIKGRGEESVAFFTTNYKSIDADCIWLDTTPRESLTPEELLSVVKVLWPDSGSIKKARYTDWIGNTCGSHTPIDWGSLTQYPPPVEPQWIRVTRENVGRYLFRECRFRDDGSQPWRTGKVSGWDVQDNCCLVYSDFEEEMPIMNWCIVEVQA